MSSVLHTHKACNAEEKTMKEENCKHHNLPKVEGTPFCKKCHEDLEKSRKGIEQPNKKQNEIL